MSYQLLSRFTLPAFIQTKEQTFFKHGLIVFMSFVIGKLLALLWKLLLARQGVEVLGSAQLLLSFIFIVSSFSLLGFHTTLIRFIGISPLKSRKKTGNYLFLTTLVTCLLISGVIVGVLVLFPSLLELLFTIPTSLRSSALLLALIIPCMVFNEIAWNYLRAFGQITQTSLQQYVLFPLYRLVILVLLLATTISREVVLVLHLVLSFALTTVTLIFSQPSLIKWKSYTFNYKKVKPFFAYSLPLSGSFVLYSVYSSLDIIILNSVKGLTTVGLWSGLLVILDTVDIFYLPFLNLIPYYLNFAYKDLQAGWRFVAKLMAVFMVAGLGVSAIYFLLSASIIRLLLGPEFMLLQAIFFPFILVKIFHSSILLPFRHLLDFYGYAQATFIAMLVAFIVKVCLLVAVLPHYGWEWLAAIHLAADLVNIVVCMVAVVVMMANHKKLSRAHFIQYATDFNLPFLRKG